MQKAISRLKKTSKATNQKYFTPTGSSSFSPKQTTQTKTKRLSLVERYLRYLPTLVLSIPFLLVSYYILTKIPPNQIKDSILPNTYLPLLVAIFLSNLFVWSFILLKTFRGLVISTIITIFLFLKLQQVLIDYSVVSIILGSSFIILVISEVPSFLARQK